MSKNMHQILAALLLVISMLFIQCKCHKPNHSNSSSGGNPTVTPIKDKECPSRSQKEEVDINAPKVHVDKGAAVDAKDNSGQAPMVTAWWESKTVEMIVRFVLAKKFKDSEGRIPYDLAEEPTIQALLKWYLTQPDASTFGATTAR